jgi:hypothetical protein
LDGSKGRHVIEVIIGFGIIGLWILLEVLDILDGIRTSRDLDRFRRSFPNKCPVCSFRLYGILHGFDVGLPTQHRCPDEIRRTESNRLPGQRYWTPTKGD